MAGLMAGAIGGWLGVRLGLSRDSFIQVGPGPGSYTMDGAYRTVIVNGAGGFSIRLPIPTLALRGILFTVLNQQPGGAIGIGIDGGGTIIDENEIAFVGAGDLIFATAGQVWRFVTDGLVWYVNY